MHYSQPSLPLLKSPSHGVISCTWRLLLWLACYSCHMRVWHANILLLPCVCLLQMWGTVIMQKRYNCRDYLVALFVTAGCTIFFLFGVWPSISSLSQFPFSVMFQQELSRWQERALDCALQEWSSWLHPVLFDLYWGVIIVLWMCRHCQEQLHTKIQQRIVCGAFFLYLVT